MSEPLPRLHLRVAQDNPIYKVAAGERNKKADEWLRIGSSTERFENAVVKLEDAALRYENAAVKIEKLLKQVGANGSIIVKEEPNLDPSDPRLDPNYERDMKLIKSIMKLGG